MLSPTRSVSSDDGSKLSQARTNSGVHDDYVVAELHLFVLLGFRIGVQLVIKFSFRWKISICAGTGRCVGLGREKRRDGEDLSTSREINVLIGVRSLCGTKPDTMKKSLASYKAPQSRSFAVGYAGRVPFDYGRHRVAP